MFTRRRKSRNVQEDDPQNDENSNLREFRLLTRSRWAIRRRQLEETRRSLATRSSHDVAACNCVCCLFYWSHDIGLIMANWHDLFSGNSLCDDHVDGSNVYCRELASWLFGENGGNLHWPCCNRTYASWLVFWFGR